MNDLSFDSFSTTRISPNVDNSLVVYNSHALDLTFEFAPYENEND